MNTEEKNALAKEYELKNRMLPENVPAQIIIVQHAFEAGLTHRDKEVSDLVEALREARKDHIDHRTLSEGVALDSSYAQGVIAHNEFVDDLDELLSKYPVNKDGNG